MGVNHIRGLIRKTLSENYFSSTMSKPPELNKFSVIMRSFIKKAKIKYGYSYQTMRDMTIDELDKLIVELRDEEFKGLKGGGINENEEEEYLSDDEIQRMLDKWKLNPQPEPGSSGNPETYEDFTDEEVFGDAGMEAERDINKTGEDVPPLGSIEDIDSFMKALHGAR